jgi:hypothetical protein
LGFVKIPEIVRDTACESVRHPIEAFRTAPFGFAVGTIALGLATLGVSYGYETITEQHPTGLFELLEDGVSLAGDALLVGLGYRAGKESVEAVGHSFVIRKRMEAALERTGYRESIVSKSLPLYCDRQATLVACNKFDVKDEYLALIKKTDPGKMEFSWFPHF